MRTISLLALAVLVVGCASTPSRWTHAQLLGPEADRQYVIDHGDCTREAIASVPPPTLQAAPSSGQAYAIQGQARTGYGVNPPTLTNYSGTVQPQSNPMQAMQAGMVAGANARAVEAAEQAQATIHAGCMAKRGWTREIVR